MIDGSATLRVVQITDLHLREQPHSLLGGVDVDTSLARVLKHLRQHHWPPDFILATGDLVQDEGAPAYARLRAVLEPLGVPVYCLPGNHDTAPVLADTLAAGLVRRERQVLADNWQFILLDTSLPDSAAGHLAPSELAFLAQSLAAYPDRHTVICLHHNPVPIGSRWLDTMTIDNAAELFAVLDRHRQVRVVLWGHIHQAFASQRNGVMLLGTPSTCAQFAPAVSEPRSDDHAAPGYRWLVLYADGRFTTAIERATAADPLPVAASPEIR